MTNQIDPIGGPELSIQWTQPKSGPLGLEQNWPALWGAVAIISNCLPRSTVGKGADFQSQPSVFSDERANGSHAPDSQSDASHDRQTYDQCHLSRDCGETFNQGKLLDYCTRYVAIEGAWLRIYIPLGNVYDVTSFLDGEFELWTLFAVSLRS